MPTGFTSKIYDGKNITKEEFIWDCARAFGALIDMRDEPFDAKIPEKIVPKTYYLNQKEEAEKELNEFLHIPHEKIQQQIEEDHAQELKYISDQIERKKTLKERYEKMLREVSEWEPPTEEHVNLKEFCIRQLKESLDFDCRGIEKLLSRKVEKPSVEEWLSVKKEHLEDELKYYEKEWEKELQCVKEKNEWIEALRQSLTEIK